MAMLLSLSPSLGVCMSQNLSVQIRQLIVATSNRHIVQKTLRKMHATRYFATFERNDVQGKYENAKVKITD